MTGDKCSTGCTTRDHETFGECLRAKQMKVAYCQSWKGHDYTKQKAWDSELSAYRDARAQGVQPDGTTRPKVEAAMKASEATGTPFQAA